MSEQRDEIVAIDEEAASLEVGTRTVCRFAASGQILTLKLANAGPG